MWNERTKPKRLNDVFPGWLTGAGIFATLQTFPVPWRNENISGALDIEYYGNVSGEKIISPLVEKIRSGDTLTDAEKTMLATSILALYGVNWGKQWETLSFEYDPIENYSMREKMTNDETVTEYGKSTTRTDNLTHRKTGTETADIDETDTRTDNLTHEKTGTETVDIDETNTRTDNLTHEKTGTETVDIDETDTRTDNLTHGKTGTETRTDNLTDTTTPNLTTNTENAVYGFNSAAAVPAGEQEQTATGTNTETHTGTEQKQYNLSETDTGTETTVKDGTNETTFNVTEQDTGTQGTVKDGTNETTFDTTETDTGTQTTVRDGTNETTFNTTDTDTGTQTTLDGGSDTHTRNYTLTRAGNIGVTTSQQMIESERALWVWNFFRNVVFPDIDQVLTIQVY